ncbi:MAG: hypothetical protein LBI74_07960 [Synergistaceae bacterium]|jgi:hypothetical protein|nr:hypothetical protein [Synergistaceae bacterium]
MEAFKIVPLKSVGTITFGMGRKEIRDLLGEWKEFKKNRFSKATTDSFGFCHVYYDTNECCEAVEFFSEAELLLNEKNIMTMTFQDFCGYVEKLDSDLQIATDGCTSKKIGLSAYAPYGEIESIFISRQDYWDN